MGFARHRHRSILAVALVAACAGLAGAPAIAQDLVIDGERIADAALLAAARKEGKLVYYGVYPESGMDLIRTAFRKDTGIEIEFVRLITQRLHPRVLTEHAARKLEADYVDLTDLTLIKDLVDKGVLNRPHKVPSFDRLAPALRDSEGRWYTTLRPCSAISINTARLPEAEAPRSWLDVFNDRWSGRIGMPSIDAGGSSFSNYMFLRDVVAPDYWNRLAALKPRIYPGILPAATDLARGETSLLIGGPEPLFEQIKAGAPVKVIFPKEGIACFPDSGGITTSARRPNAAALMLNWMTSKRGGDAIASSGAYGSHPASATPKPAGVAFPPASQVWNISLDDWLAKRDRYSNEWRQVFGVK